MGISWKNNKAGVAIFLVLVFSIYISFGLYHLTKFEMADERYWMYENPVGGRIRAYWTAVSEGRLSGTYINDKPGVSLAYISGVALLFKSNPAENLFLQDDIKRFYNSSEIERIHFLFRFPLLIFNGLFCLLLCWFIWKFTDNCWIALWSTTFILLSPILLGASQIINPDSLLWSFSAGAIFAFLSYLKSRENKFVFFSAFFLGFSLLSKYSAIILIPFLLVIILADIVFDSARGKKISSQEIIQVLRAYIFLIIGSLAVFSLFLPVVFTNPEYFYGIFTKLRGFQYLIFLIGLAISLLFADAFFYDSKAVSIFAEKIKKLVSYIPRFLAGLFLGLFIFIIFTWMTNFDYGENMRDIPFDAGLGTEFKYEAIYTKVILELVPLLFSLTPLALFAVIFILGKSVVEKTVYAKIVSLILFFMIAFYTAVILQGLLVTIRYSLMLYPLAFLLASIGIWELASSKYLMKINKVWITAGVVLLSFWSLWTSKPFYFNYTNILLPENRMIVDAWGYGNFEMAEYVNHLPNAKDLFVWVDHKGYCVFLESWCVVGNGDGLFFLGKTSLVPDYIVKTRRGSIVYKGAWKTAKEKLLDKNATPAWSLLINEKPKNYIEVFKTK
jgi:hypothetical protein